MFHGGTKRKGCQPGKSILFSVIAALILWGVACSTPGSRVSRSTAIPPATDTPTPYATATASTPTKTPYPTFAITRYPTEEPCLKWDTVTAEREGQIKCVYGVIYAIELPRSGGSRYTFTAEPNRFFLYSGRWEIYNKKTGKTVGDGWCVEVTAQIRLQSGVPYISLDDLAKKEHGTVKNFSAYPPGQKSCK